MHTNTATFHVSKSQLSSAAWPQPKPTSGLTWPSIRIIPPQRPCKKATIAGRRLHLFPSTVITAAPQQAEACFPESYAHTGFMLSQSDVEAIAHG